MEGALSIVSIENQDAQVIYDDAFLNMHREIKVLSKKFLKPSRFVLSYISDRDEIKEEFIKLLIENSVDGYLSSKVGNDKYDDIRDVISGQPDRFDRQKLILKEILDNIEFYIGYFKNIIEDKTSDTCVFYVNFEENLFKKFSKLLSPSEIISGVVMNNVTQKVKRKDNLVGIIISSDGNSNAIYFQSNFKLKSKIYDMLNELGNIYIDGYKNTFLIQRGLLWGVPLLPNVENAKILVDNLKSK